MKVVKRDKDTQRRKTKYKTCIDIMNACKTTTVITSTRMTYCKILWLQILDTEILQVLIILWWNTVCTS